MSKISTSPKGRTFILIKKILIRKGRLYGICLVLCGLSRKLEMRGSPISKRILVHKTLPILWNLKHCKNLETTTKSLLFYNSLVLWDCRSSFRVSNSLIGTAAMLEFLWTKACLSCGTFDNARLWKQPRKAHCFITLSSWGSVEARLEYQTRPLEQQLC